MGSHIDRRFDSRRRFMRHPFDTCMEELIFRARFPQRLRLLLSRAKRIDAGSRNLHSNAAPWAAGTVPSLAVGVGFRGPRCHVNCCFPRHLQLGTDMVERTLWFFCCIVSSRNHAPSYADGRFDLERQV